MKSGTVQHRLDVELLAGAVRVVLVVLTQASPAALCFHGPSAHEGFQIGVDSQMGKEVKRSKVKKVKRQESSKLGGEKVDV